MPLPTDKESQRGSQTELNKFLGEQPKSKGQVDKTKTAIELVEYTAKSFEEEVDKRNDKEGPGYGKLLGGLRAQSCDKDVVHDEININVLYQELTMEKMWHGRTWSEILKHFAITLIIGVLPTFFDVGTDINAVLEYWYEGNHYWSLISMVLIFFPGLFCPFLIRKAFNIDFCCQESLSSIRSYTCCMFLFHPLSPFGYLLFPFVLIAVKTVGLFNPGPE